MGLLYGKKVTVHPDYKSQMHGTNLLNENIVVDGNIVTGRGLGASILFAITIVELLVGKEESQRISREICFDWHANYE